MQIRVSGDGRMDSSENGWNKPEEVFVRGKMILQTMGLGVPQTVEFYLELRKMQIQESIGF
ncbi:MAG: hypothetical protein ACLVIY_07320 [Anaerobutyricum soehngenii]